MRLKPKKLQRAVCPKCHSTFGKTHANQKYCEQCREKRKTRQCRWCGENFKITFESKNRRYCFKKECEQRQWLWTLLNRYNRCRQCHSIIPRGQTEWGSYNFCPFCLGSIKKEVRERYVQWLRNQPRHVTALLPNPTPPLRHATQYAKQYNIDNIKFQTFCPISQEQL